ncbi:MAG: PKD domain-containing protein [Bacteroidota bacterium]
MRSSVILDIWGWRNFNRSNPVHNYTTPGIFDVSLTVQTQSGCQNSITIPAAVRVVLRPLIGITGMQRYV